MAGFADIFTTNQAGRGGRVTNAIAMASQRTGIDFGYLLGQARIESGFNPTARAATSSATGLFQFVDQSWLAVINDHGATYGLDWAADAVQRGSNGRYYVADPALRQQILDLRNHPETASVMAAASAGDNKAYLEARTGRAAGAVDLYLAHFLGPAGAARFIEGHAANPDGNAAAALPTAARANRSIFYDRNGGARSFAEIRDAFARKLQAGANSVGATVSDVPMAPGWSLPPDAPVVAPADYLRIAQARNAAPEPAASDVAAIAEPDTPASAAQAHNARLAYLMLATFGR
jgi:hypothetical protein